MFQKTLYHVVRGREDLLIFEFADHTHEQEIRKNIEDALESRRVPTPPRAVPCRI